MSFTDQLWYLWRTTSVPKIIKIGNVHRRKCSRPDHGWMNVNADE